MFVIDYHFHPKIVHIKLSGKIKATEAEALAHELYSTLTEPQILLLTDAREAQYEIGIKDLDTLLLLIEKYQRPQCMVFEAILIDKPYETAISTIFNKKKSDKAHETKIFFTEEAALAWLFSLA